MSYHEGMAERERPLRGMDIIHDSRSNKGTGFTREERRNLGLRGLLPYQISSQELQAQRVMENFRRKENNMERYIFLRSLEERNERLFFRVLMDNIRELMPIVYTPTVGQACQQFANIFRHAKGFYITPEDRGHIRDILNNWPVEDVRIIVVTDGERILGLGDLGANGMGIPIGKLSLYTAAGGIDPLRCMPVMLDVGTDNTELLNDPLYMGWPHARLRGREYQSLVEEFVFSVQDKYPKALIQFEDFATPNAYHHLKRFRQAVLSFNDDIQGTAAVAVAGLKAALRISGTPLRDLRVMFLGAGSAATGMAHLLTRALMEAGLSEGEARKQVQFVDEHGLLISSRKDLTPQNIEYSVDSEARDFVSAIREFKPHAIIGATGVPGTFSREVVESMAAVQQRPIIFALSNPTERAECSAAQAYEWSGGRAIFASGSPFQPLEYEGKRFEPAQGNNVYIFPGVGLGAISVAASRISDSMFLAAADALAARVKQEQLERGSIFPPLTELRNISLDIAEAVALKAYEQNLARYPLPDDLRELIQGLMYDPSY